MWAEDGITFGSVTALAMTTGGDVDVTMSRHVAIRPVQAEYFLTKFPDGNNNRQNNFRFSAGFRLGRLEPNAGALRRITLLRAVSKSPGSLNAQSSRFLDCLAQR